MERAKGLRLAILMETNLADKTESRLAINIVVLTGAGVSTESGIPTFRDSNGLWEGHRVADVATPEAFRSNPQLVYKFYNERRAAVNAALPNAAHKALARLEQACRGEFLIVTQNIDDLHERAGSRRVLHMHGDLFRARCLACGRISPARGPLGPGSTCEQCNRSGSIRPDVVWFGEHPYGMAAIFAAVDKADLFLCVGTSGVVHPAAGIVEEVAKRQSCRMIEINPKKTAISHFFHQRLRGPASIEVPKVVDQTIQSLSRVRG